MPWASCPYTIMAGEIITDLGDHDARTLLHNSMTPSMTSGVLATPLPAGNPNSCSTTDLDPTRPQFWSTTAALTDEGIADRRRGYNWACHCGQYSQVYTISPPNKPICNLNFNANEDIGSNFRGPGILPPSSRHQGGCHVLMGDGAVKYVTDSIEAGNQSVTPVCKGGAAGPPSNVPGALSPYGLWGALGTRANKGRAISLSWFVREPRIDSDNAAPIRARRFSYFRRTADENLPITTRNVSDEVPR